MCRLALRTHCGAGTAGGAAGGKDIDDIGAAGDGGLGSGGALSPTFLN